MKNSVVLAVHEIARAAEKGGTPEQQLQSAMKAASTHWLLTDRDEQFQAALGGALISIKDTDYRNRIEQEIKSLKALNAALSGVSVNFSEADYEPIGLVKMWREATMERIQD